MTHVVIDWTRCDGHGVCHELVPELIDLDDWGFPIVNGQGISGELVKHAKRAVTACPALALRVER